MLRLSFIPITFEKSPRYRIIVSELHRQAGHEPLSRIKDVYELAFELTRDGKLRQPMHDIILRTLQNAAKRGHVIKVEEITSW